MLIHHAGGSRTIDAYRLPAATHQYERWTEQHAVEGTRTLRFGDGKPRPAPFVVEALVRADSLLEAADLAYQIVAESRVAHEVVTYQGSRLVDGIIAYQVAADGSDVALRLEFAPVSATMKMRVAFVVSNALSPTASEAAVAAYLTQQRHMVTLFTGTAGPTGVDLDLYDAVLIDESITATPTTWDAGGAAWHQVALPVLTYKPRMWHDAGIAATSGGVDVPAGRTHTALNTHYVGGVLTMASGTPDPPTVTLVAEGGATGAITVPTAEGVVRILRQASVSDGTSLAVAVGGSGFKRVALPFSHDIGLVWTARSRAILLNALRWVRP
jgi:hypothetical protein